MGLTRRAAEAGVHANSSYYIASRSEPYAPYNNGAGVKSARAELLLSSSSSYGRARAAGTDGSAESGR